LTDIRFSETYKSFRQNLDYVIQDSHPESKEQLKILMGRYGFRKNKKGERFYPSDKQLDLAWNYTFKKEAWKPLSGVTYRAERRKTYTVYRATSNFYYKGKLYKKGRFVPKGVKDV
jgi:hypothetical protein